MKFLLSSRRAWSIACLAILLCLAAPLPSALAQEGYGEWQPRLRYKVKESWSPKQNDWDSQTRTEENVGGSLYYMSYYLNNNYSPEAGSATEITGEVDVVLEWVPSNYRPASRPPADDVRKISVRLNSLAAAHVYGAGITQSSIERTLENGFGSPIKLNTEANYLHGASSEGGRLVGAAVTRDADGVWRARAGTYKLRVKVSVEPKSVPRDQPYTYFDEETGEFVTSYTHWTGSSARGRLEFTAQYDTRSVSITSTLDPTYRREVINGVPTRVENEADASATVHADTVALPVMDTNEVTVLDHLMYDLAPSTRLMVSYAPLHWGEWPGGLFNQNRYEWTFTLGKAPSRIRSIWYPGPIGGIPAEDQEYLATEGQARPGQVEHSRLVATGVDGLAAEANYILKFHSPYELVREFPVKTLPEIPVREHLSEWEYLAAIENRSDQPLLATVQVKRSAAGILGWLFGERGEAEKLHLFELTPMREEIETSLPDVTVPMTVTVPARTRRHFYQGLAREFRSGVSSKWERNGYVGDVSWNFTTTSGLWTVVADETQDTRL